MVVLFGCFIRESDSDVTFFRRNFPECTSALAEGSAETDGSKALMAQEQSLCMFVARIGC